MFRIFSNSRIHNPSVIGFVTCNKRALVTETTPTSHFTSNNLPLTPASGIFSREDSLSASFRCVQNDPLCHTHNHEAQFYQIPTEDYRRLFTFGGVLRSHQRKIKSFNEFCLMVRRPALEVIGYLQQANYAHPINRYIMHGVVGSGKTMSLAHVIHFCSKQDWFIVHVPWPPLYVRILSEIVESSHKKGRIDLPVHAVAWLQQFKLQNMDLLQNLKPKISNTYTWNKREVTEAGSLFTDVIDQGINRVKYSSDCVGALLKEIKLLANAGSLKVLVAIDAVNSFFSTTRLKREDRSMITTNDISLIWNFKKMLKADWKNGAVVATVDLIGSPDSYRESHLPRYLLNKEGFELVDPFIPIFVENYSFKEINSCLDYYVDRRWIQSAKGKTDEGRDQLIFLSGCNPMKLAELCAPY